MSPNEGFVMIKGEKGIMFTLRNRKELQEFLEALTPDDLTDYIWDSLKEAFKMGKKKGFNQRQMTQDK